MGIQGLLPLLKDCQNQTHIRNYKGQTLGVDAYVWLHKGAYGCAQELATGEQTVKYVKYAMHRVRMLKHFGVKPYIVFDGGPLPSKLHTENDREGRRMNALKQALSLVAEGKHAQARDFFVQAVDVTPQMAYQLIKALKAEDVPYVVAPYEADAQLAYLERTGFIDGIITEDSDLLVYGCKQVLFKLDSEGACVEIKRENLTMCRQVSFHGWTDTAFRHMAILAGCDYLENIQGLGLKTAHALIRRCKSPAKAIQYVAREGRFKRVFCPEQQKLVHCTPLPDNLPDKAEVDESITFIGAALSAEVAAGIARGDICPISKEAMVDIVPDHLAERTARPKAGNASIQDFFTAKPVPKARPTKKVKESRSTANNLFRPKPSDAPPTTAKPVKSRFFGKPLASVASTSQQVIVDLSASTEEEEGLMNIVASPREQEEPALGDMLEGIAFDGEDPFELLELHEELEEQTTITFAASVSNHQMEQPIKAEPLTPRKAVPQWPFRSASPRAPLSETGFSHISSPLNIDEALPAVKANASEEDSGFYEPENGSGGTCILSSPVTSSPPKARLTLYESKQPIRNGSQEASTSETRPIRSPPRRKPSSGSFIDTENNTSVKVEPNGARSSRSSSSVSLSSPPASALPKLQRRNAVVAPSFNKGKKRKSSVMPDDDVEEEDKLLDDKLQSVMSSWRERFSAGASRSRSSTPSAAFRSGRKPTSALHLSAQSTPSISNEANPSKRTKVSSKASSDVDMEEEQEAVVTAKVKAAPRSIAPTSTSSRLEAFRFRSVNSLASSSSSSSILSSQG